MLENTEGAMQQDNPEKRATQDTQDEYMLENTDGDIKKDNPEKLATQGTQETGQINVREYRRGN